MGIRDHVDAAPGEAQIGMMPLGLGYCADAVHELQSLLEISKEEMDLACRLLDKLITQAKSV